MFKYIFKKIGFAEYIINCFEFLDQTEITVKERGGKQMMIMH